MLLRRIAQLNFCCCCWFALVSGELSTNSQSLFQVFVGIRISGGKSGDVAPGKTLFWCFMECIRDPLCSAINYKSYNDKFSDSMVECEFLHQEGHSQLVVSVDPLERTAVKSSFLHDSFQASNISSSNITIEEIVSITNGQGEKFCFLHCVLRGSGCQELEKSCLTNDTIRCQVYTKDLSLPIAMFLHPNCSSDISQIGKY